VAADADPAGQLVVVTMTVLVTTATADEDAAGQELTDDGHPVTVMTEVARTVNVVLLFELT